MPRHHLQPSQRLRAATMAEYKGHLCRPLPKPGKAEASRRSMRELIPEPRFSRAVHDKAGEITGEKGCNYCRAMKPIEKLTRIKRGGGRVRLICDTCKAARDKGNVKGTTQPTVEETTDERSRGQGEVLEDAISLCKAHQDDHRLWCGDVGLSNNQREDVNDRWPATGSPEAGRGCLRWNASTSTISGIAAGGSAASTFPSLSAWPSSKPRRRAC